MKTKPYRFTAHWKGHKARKMSMPIPAHWKSPTKKHGLKKHMYYGYGA